MFLFNIGASDLLIGVCSIIYFVMCADSELEELDTPIRYRPDSLGALCRTTRFTEAEIKRIYRGFKAECPTGVVREDTFKLIYSQFFPQGGMLSLVHKYYVARGLTECVCSFWYHRTMQPILDCTRTMCSKHSTRITVVSSVSR